MSVINAGLSEVVYQSAYPLGDTGLSVHLVRVGRRTGSPALVADGIHVRTDVVTSAAVIAGLALVKVTGWSVLDPLVALVAAANILREGWHLLQGATSGLMNAVPESRLAPLVDALQAARPAEWIDAHDLRAFESGATMHLDVHLTVPRYLSVEAAHHEHDAVKAALGGTGETVDALVHFDPCEPQHCAACVMPDCELRAAPAAGQAPLTLERMLGAPGPAAKPA